MLAQALRRFNQELREMMEKLLNGEPLTPEEMDQLDQMLNKSEMNDLRYQNWMARQLEQALNFNEVRQALEELMQLLNEMGMNREQVEQLRQALQANQRAMQEQLRQHAGEQILHNMIENHPHEPRDGLLNRPFQAFSEDDMHQLRQEVRRLAAALRTRLALRLHRARTGQLDLKSTLRANLKHGSVPIELRHRDHTLKPKLVVICDISTSMRYCSELMLSLLYAIQDQISKTHAFTFIDHLEYISPYFDHNAANAGHRPGPQAHAWRSLQHRPGLFAARISIRPTWTRSITAPPLSSSAMGATTSTIHAWTSSAELPAVREPPSGSIRSRRPCGAPAIRTCTITPRCATAPSRSTICSSSPPRSTSSSALINPTFNRYAGTFIFAYLLNKVDLIHHQRYSSRTCPPTCYNWSNYG